MQPSHGLRNHAKHTDESDLHWHRNAPDNPHSTDSEDKGSLNAFRSLLNYGIHFNQETLRDDTYGHARPYNLVLMSTRSLWIIYILFYAVILSSTIFSLKQAMFTSDVKIIEMPNFALLSSNASLISHGYNPSDSVFNGGGRINKSIANIYFHNDSYYPYQEYIYLYGHLTLHRDINTSDPFISDLLSGAYLFNYSVLLNITNNQNVLGYETKHMQNTNFFDRRNPCSIDAQCVFTIWSPYDDNGFSASWQNTILYNYKSKPNAAMLFNTSIVFYNFNLNRYGNLSLSYVYEKEHWVQFEFYTKCTFAAITMISLILWIVYGLRNHRKDLIAEQRWMVVLFMALLLYQDPLTVGLFASDSFDAIYLLSSLFFATSINLFMIYWSLMIDSIRQIKNLIDVGVTFGCKFYRFKLLAICVSYASALVFTLTTQYLIQNNTENKSYNGYFYTQSNHSLVVITVLISGCIWFTCVSCFLIWLFSSLWNANKELNKLPYIETRERQLSLRYFKHHTFLVIIYIILISIYNVYSHRSPLVLVDNRRVDIGTLTVVSVYVYLVAFMYLPMTNNEIKMAQHGFQLSNAIFMCHVAWQSYLAPKDDDIEINSKDIDTVIDRVKLEYFNLELIEFVTNKQHDVQIIVSKGRIHKLFKKQKAQMHAERISTGSARDDFLRRRHKLMHQPLLLAPKRSDQSRFLEDVSSDDDDASISSCAEIESVSSHRRHRHSKSPRSSILSFEAIKTLFHIKRNKRATTVFNRTPRTRRYGSTEEIKQNDALSVINDEAAVTPISTPKLHQKALSLFSGQKSYANQVNVTPLLSSYEDNISSVSSAAVHSAYDSQPISVEYDDYHAPSLLPDEDEDDDEDDDMDSIVTLHDDDKQLNDLLDYERIHRSLTVHHEQEYSHRFDDSDEERERERSSTMTSHGLQRKRKRKRNQNIGFRMRIPLLSNLLPHAHERQRRAKRKVKYMDIVIGFRGTDSSVNVKLDLKFRRMNIEPSFWYEMALDDSLRQRKEWKKCVRPCIAHYSGSDDGNDNNPLNIPFMKIHSGFYQSFKDIRNELMHSVLTSYYEIIRKKKKIPRFYVTGHSLGGALAQLFALCLEIWFGHRSLIHVYVYGCPRVGDKRFSDYLSQRVKHLYRVVFRGDIVTTIPRGFAYYKHGGYEMVIDDHGNMINHPSKAEKALLPSRTSLKDHGLANYVDSLNAIAKKHKLPHLMVEVP